MSGKSAEGNRRANWGRILLAIPVAAFILWSAEDELFLTTNSNYREEVKAAMEQKLNTAVPIEIVEIAWEALIFHEKPEDVEAYGLMKVGLNEWTMDEYRQFLMACEYLVYSDGALSRISGLKEREKNSSQ